MAQSGPHNALTDVEGVLVGHFTDLAAVSGVTVAVCPQGAVAGVDVRGSAPGTRETDLLNPINLCDQANAIVLSGGSVYGHAVSDGVVRWLAEKGWGFPLEEGQVAPIVPGAVLYDLGRGPQFVPPITPEWGRAACESAQEGPVPVGSVGAGTGALSGGDQRRSGHGQRGFGLRGHRGRPDGGEFPGHRGGPGPGPALGASFAVGRRVRPPGRSGGEDAPAA